MTPILASMLEVMDRFGNLDLLSDGRLSRGLRELWLDILADSQSLILMSLHNSRYDRLLVLCDSNGSEVLKELHSDPEICFRSSYIHELYSFVPL